MCVLQRELVGGYGGRVGARGGGMVGGIVLIVRH